MAPDVVFDLALEHGRCLGVRIPNDAGELEALALSVLAPEERESTAGSSPPRRRTWVGGRVAMRTALVRAGIDAPPVLADERGAPLLPRGISGSISHSDWIGVALVAREPAARVGVDVERDVASSIDVSRHVLASEEIAEIEALAMDARPGETLLRFSAKESVYKALDPFVRRYVGFKEVSVTPRPAGDARVVSRLRPEEGPFSIAVRWRRFDGLVLTTARVEPRAR